MTSADSRAFGALSHDERLSRALALSLAIPLACLPWLLLLPLDIDRALPLAFGPAIMLGLQTMPRKWSGRIVCLVCIALAMAISALASTHVARSLVMSASVLLALLAGVAAAGTARSAPAVRLVLWGLVAGAVSGAAMVRIGVAADRMNFPVYWSARLFGAHQFSGVIAALVLLRQSEARLKSRALPALAASLTLTALAWSGSRAPALGLLVFMICWAWRGGRREVRFLLCWAPALTGFALVCSYLLGAPYPQLGWWQAFERTADAVNSTGIEVPVLTSSRTAYWEASWKQFLRSPWIGNGADAYLFLVPKQPGNQPHSAIIQWLLEHGVIGAAAWLALLVHALRPVPRPRLPDSETGATLIGAETSVAAIAGASVYALFEGVFYHMIIFIPVAVLGGLRFGARSSAKNGSQIAESGLAPFWFRLPALGCAALLLVHNWLYVLMLKAPNVAPDSLPPRVLRAFPSTTYAIQNWTERWRRSDPELAFEWIRWAQSVSTNPAELHAYAAQLHLWRREWSPAEAELLGCLEKANPAEEEDIRKLIAEVRLRAANTTAPASDAKPILHGNR